MSNFFQSLGKLRCGICKKKLVAHAEYDPRSGTWGMCKNWLYCGWASCIYCFISVHRNTQAVIPIRDFDSIIANQF